MLIFVALAASIAAAAGYFYYHSYERHYRTEMEQELSAIAALKTYQLTEWRQERLGYASILFRNTAFSALVRRSFQNPAD